MSNPELPTTVFFDIGDTLTFLNADNHLLDLLHLLPALADIGETNLHLAPPAKRVDGLWAVPIDIRRITAALSFDGSSSTGTGDATLEFRMGHHAGNPIFDLRQTINSVWTVYNDHGASESQPFSFTDPAVTLCQRNPWARITAGGAYSDGYRFWKGVASLIGAGTLRALMSEFYQVRRHRTWQPDLLQQAASFSSISAIGLFFQAMPYGHQAMWSILLSTGVSTLEPMRSGHWIPEKRAGGRNRHTRLPTLRVPAPF